MDNKSWNEYSILEKKSLLNLWFYYTSSGTIKREEAIKFRELLDQDVDLIMHLAVCQAMIGQSANQVVLSMRNGTIDTVLTALPEMDGTEDYEYVKKLTIAMLVRLYDNIVARIKAPEPIKPMESVVEIVQDFQRHYK